MSNQSDWVIFSPRHQHPVGIYGWRKRCLYLLVLSLLLVVIINLALTIWIIQVLKFNSDGMGGLQLVQRGIQLPDVTYVFGSLIMSTLYSYNPMVIDSYRNITIATINATESITNQLQLEQDLLQLSIETFKVSDAWDNTVFMVNKEEVVVGTDNLALNGEGGSNFEGKLQTSNIEAEKKNLRLESPGGNLEIHSSAAVSIKSTAGGINLSAGFNLELSSGALRIESSSIILPGLADITGNILKRKGIFQLCVCDNGKLFYGPSNEMCARTEQSILC